MAFTQQVAAASYVLHIWFRRVRRRIALSATLVAIAFALTPASAAAAVAISFYSHEWDNKFPHAFIVLAGTDDRTGVAVNDSYGFTALNVSPAILMGSVKGEVIASEPRYIAASDEHFRFTLTDPEYDSVLATVAKWRALKQPSYNLNRRNCVFFVADVAATLGMAADTPPALMKKPRSYLESLVAANQAWLEARGAVVLRAPPPSPRSPASPLDNHPPFER